MPDINKHEVDIENLFKQNANDLSAIKELYRKLKEMEEKITQIKYIDSTLAKKLKKEYESLKKQILDENVQVQLNNKIDETKTSLTKNINEINSQLKNKVTKSKGLYCIKDFYNDNITDTVLFKNAIEEISTSGGGELRLESKTYTIDSLVSFTSNIKNIDIIGVTNATIIKLTNSDYGIIFNNPVLRIKFKNIRFELSSTNKGIYFPYTSDFSYHVYFDNCNFYGGINNVTIEHGAYIYFEKSTFTVENVCNDDARITLGSTSNTSCYNEYIYFKNCNIDGKQGVGIGNGINVYQCEYLTIDGCDIPNWYGDDSTGTRLNGYGINLETYGRIWDIYILNCSIPRCNVDVNLYAKNSAIQKVFINNLFDFTPKTSWATDSRVIKTTKDGDYSINWLTIEKLNILPDSTYKRTYDLELKYINYGYVENIGDNILVNTTNCNFFDVKMMRTELRKSNKKIINDSNLTLTVETDITIVTSELNNKTLSLSTINGGSNGYVCYILPKTSNKLTLVNGTIVLKDGANKILSSNDRITLVYLDGKWYEI